MPPWKYAWCGLHFTALRKSTQFGLVHQVSVSYRTPFCLSRPASRGQNGKRTNAPLKRRIILRWRLSGSRLFSVSATERRHVGVETGPIRKRNITKVIEFGIFWGDAEKCSMHPACLQSELIWYILTMPSNLGIRNIGLISLMKRLITRTYIIAQLSESLFLS